MALQEVISSSTDESIKNYDAGLCSALTSDLSQLYALRLRLAKPRDQVILPDVISKEPLGPVVRNNDLQWISIVRWVYFAMINAEELGVSSQTIDQALRSQKPEVKRLVGTTGDFGEQIGLTNAWAANIIRTVGNYGEVFERNLGAKTPLAIPRVSINYGAKAAFNTPRRSDDRYRNCGSYSASCSRRLLPTCLRSLAVLPRPPGEERHLTAAGSPKQALPLESRNCWPQPERYGTYI